MTWHRSALLMLMGALVLTACGGGENTSVSDQGTTDARGQVVIDYLTAKLASDRDTLRDLLCSDMESRLEEEALSFSSVDAELRDASCAGNANSDTVTCTGVIAATYGTELREFPLTTYRVVEEDGQPRWCGEAAAP
jgi:hypothetical protein